MSCLWGVALCQIILIDPTQITILLSGEYPASLFLENFQFCPVAQLTRKRHTKRRLFVQACQVCRDIHARQISPVENMYRSGIQLQFREMMRERLQLRFIEQTAAQRQARVLESHDLNVEDRGPVITLGCQLIES